MPTDPWTDLEREWNDQMKAQAITLPCQDHGAAPGEYCGGIDEPGYGVVCEERVRAYLLRSV